jgi:hypothetical protein
MPPDETKRKAKTSYPHHPSQKRKTKTIGNRRRPVFPTQETRTTQNQEQIRINNHRRTQIMMEYPEQKYSEKKIQIDSKGRNFPEKLLRERIYIESHKYCT